MFADPTDLAELATSAFDEVIHRTVQEATTRNKGDGGGRSGGGDTDLLLLLGDSDSHNSNNPTTVLSPWEYRFAYLTVFGTMPSEADIQLVYELGGSGGSLSSMMGPPPASTQPPTSLLQDKLSYLSTISPTPRQKHQPSQDGPTMMTRDRFVRRMHDKHVALYGPFEQQGGKRRMPLLWSVFDSVDVDAKGYFTLDDLRRAAANVVGREDQDALDRMVGMCEQAFVIADEDKDGRVYFDRFEWMATQL